MTICSSVSIGIYNNWELPRFLMSLQQRLYVGYEELPCKCASDKETTETQACRMYQDVVIILWFNVSVESARLQTQII